MAPSCCTLLTWTELLYGGTDFNLYSATCNLYIDYPNAGPGRASAAAGRYAEWAHALVRRRTAGFTGAHSAVQLSSDATSSLAVWEGFGAVCSIR